MLPATRILLRVIVESFYRRHSGQLLVLFFLSFGMVEGSQLFKYHLALIYGVLGSTELLLLVFAGWSLYCLKCMQFTMSELDKPENAFLNTMICLPTHQHFLAIFISQTLIMMPIVAYGIAIVTIGFYAGILVPSFSITAFLILLITLSSVTSRKKIYSRPFRLPMVSLIPAGWGKNWPLAYLGFLSNDIKLIFFLSKVLSLLALFVFLQIDLGHYEIRLAWMGMLLGVIAHSVLVYEVRKWEDRCLSVAKNLPLSAPRRFANLTMTYSVLVLPELIFLQVYHIAWLDIPLLFAFFVSGVLFLHTFLYEIQMNSDRYLRSLLLIFLIVFGLILFQLYPWIPAAAIVMAWAWYRSYFYSFEPAT